MRAIAILYLGSLAAGSFFTSTEIKQFLLQVSQVAFGLYLAVNAAFN
jgi:hypothetical protein